MHLPGVHPLDPASFQVVQDVRSQGEFRDQHLDAPSLAPSNLKLHADRSPVRRTRGCAVRAAAC
eukprot:3085247-Rhodomonas_salina.2